MTGFGLARASTPWGRVSVEIKTVNNRFLDLQIRTPRLFSSTESNIRSFLSGRFVRGSVFVGATLDEGGKETAETFSWNKVLVKAYVCELRKIGKLFGLKGDVTLDMISRNPDLINRETPLVEPIKLWKELEPVFLSAFEKTDAMRRAEGQKLEKAIRGHLDAIEESLERVIQRAPQRIVEYRAKLEKNIRSLLGEAEPDANRLMTEIGVMSERLDIEEECIRLKSHIDQFRRSLKLQEEVGKRLGFLLQEMGREVNTIGSKANDSLIGQESVSLKERLEIIREQVQNIE